MNKIENRLALYLAFFFGLYFMSTTTYAQKHWTSNLDKGSYNLYIEALQNSDNPAKAPIYCDSLEQLAQERQDPYILYAAAYAKAANYIRTPKVKRSTEDISNVFKTAQERSKATGDDGQCWLLESLEISYLLDIQRYSDAKKRYDTMLDKAQAKHDYIGLLYANRAKAAIGYFHGNANEIKDCINEMFEINKLLKKNITSTDVFSIYSRLETDKNKVIEIYKLGLENSSDITSSALLMELMYISALKRDKENFDNWHNRYLETLDKLEKADIHISHDAERKARLMAYAFDNKREEAYLIADSILLEKNKFKEAAAVALGDYKTALECSKYRRNELYNNINNAEDFDNTLLSEFIMNERLRNDIMNQQLNIIELEAAKNKLLRTKAELISEQNREISENAAEILQNINEERKQKEKENQLRREEEKRMQRKATAEKNEALQSRNILITTAISLLLIIIFAAFFFYIQRKNVKSLKRMKEKIESGILE